MTTSQLWSCHGTVPQLPWRRVAMKALLASPFWVATAQTPAARPSCTACQATPPSSAPSAVSDTTWRHCRMWRRRRGMFTTLPSLPSSHSLLASSLSQGRIILRYLTPQPQPLHTPPPPPPAHPHPLLTLRPSPQPQPSHTNPSLPPPSPPYPPPTPPPISFTLFLNLFFKQPVCVSLFSPLHPSPPPLPFFSFTFHF